jgi:hypothetical protein
MLGNDEADPTEEQSMGILRLRPDIARHYIPPVIPVGQPRGRRHGPLLLRGRCHGDAGEGGRAWGVLGVSRWECHAGP